MQKKAIIQEVWSKARRNCYVEGDLKSESKKAEISVLQAVFPVQHAGAAIACVRTTQRNSYTPPFLLTSSRCFWNTFRRHRSLDSSFWRACLAFLLLQLRLGGIIKLKNRRRINRRRILIKIIYLFEGLLRVSLLDGDDDPLPPLLLLLPILTWSGHSANGKTNKSESRELWATRRWSFQGRGIP